MKSTKPLRYFVSFVLILITANTSFGQYCDSTVPSFTVDLSASPNMNWVSPPVQRQGLCCGVVNPDQCLEFIITLHPSAIAVNFNIASGAVPPGALFYQIDCGPQIPVGQPICLNGPGPHHLTFCKPGNNVNTFSIISYSEPIIGPDITMNAGCQDEIYVQYYNEPSITWTSIFPGPQGAYDGLLGCTSGCDTTSVTAPANPPAYVDYQVCGTDIGGCNPYPICDTIRVNFVPPVTVNISALTTSLCQGETTTLTANVTGGTGPYNILWNTNEVTTQITGPAGAYDVQVTDASGCLVATDNIIINQYAVPPVTAGNDVTVCEGIPVTLSGSGAVSYAWTGGVTDGVAFVQPVGSVNYTVTGTDANGCTATDQVNVTVNPNPIVNAGNDVTVCEGTAVTLTGSGASTYAWDNGVTDGIAFTPPVGSTTYTVTGTDANGCFNTDQVNVLVNPTPIVGANPDMVVCEGTSVTLNGSGAVSYAWDNGVSDGVAFVPPVGNTTYTVTGTDANGCIDTETVDILVNPNPIVDAGPNQQMCNGSAVILSGSGASTYQWNNGVSDGVPFGQPVGTMTYTVIGTDGNGCSASDQVDVTVYPLPNVSAGSDIEVCEGTPVTLYGSGANSYVWDNGVTNGVPFTPNVGSTVYTVIGTDNNGCSSSDDMTVIVHPTPQVETVADMEFCEGTSAILYGSGATTYSWTGGVVDGVSFVPPVGNSNYIVTGTDNYGCTDTAAVNILVNPNPNINGGPDQELCEGNSVILNAIGAMNYLWSGGVQNGVPFTPTPGQYIFTVTGTDANGCEDTDQVLVIVNPNPVVNAGPDQTDCEGTEITLSATGSSNLTWSSGIINNQPFVQAVGTVTYTVYDTLPTGCTAFDEVVVTINPNPVVTATNDELCEGEAAILYGGGAEYYEWTGGVIDGVPFYPNATSIYYVTGYDSNGCSSTAFANVTVNPLPYVSFTWENQDLSMTAPGTGFNNLSSGAGTFYWDFGDGYSSSEFEPYHEFPDDEGAEYFVTLEGTSVDGCVASVTQYINVAQDYSLFVPNAFTPDNNGVNEIFTPVLFGYDPEDFTMYIFNRWGELVYETHDMNRGWDGSYGRDPSAVQDGVYTWKIEARVLNSRERQVHTGHVALIK